MFCTKGGFILRIGYKGIRRGWRSKQDKGASVQFYPLTPPDQVSTFACVQKTEWYRLPHWTPLTSDFRLVLGRRSRGKGNEIRYLLTCFLPCWIAAGWRCSCYNSYWHYWKAHFQSLPTIAAATIAGSTTRNRKGNGFSFLLSSNLFVSARHWPIQGSWWHVVHRFPAPCNTEEGTGRPEWGWEPTARNLVKCIVPSAFLKLYIGSVILLVYLPLFFSLTLYFWDLPMLIHVAPVYSF